MNDIETQFPGLIDALIKVESADATHPDGNDEAIGDKGLASEAYGCLQIRQPYVDDVNRAYHTTYKAIQCLGDRTLSILFFKEYMAIYAKASRLKRAVTAEDIARIHNGGPNGWQNPATVGYWEKVQKILWK